MADKVPQTMHESLQDSLEKGNINFDFLNPELQPGNAAPDTASERRNTTRHGKRGLFNRGRMSLSVTNAQIIRWIFVLLFSLGSLIAIFMSQSLLWLLLVPVALSLSLWSLLMIPLLLARPR